MVVIALESCIWANLGGETDSKDMPGEGRYDWLTIVKCCLRF